MLNSLSSEKIKKLLIDLKAPETELEINYIKNLKEKYKRNNIDIFSEEALSERKKIIKNHREAELILGDLPKTVEEKEFLESFNKTKNKRNLETKNFNDRKLKALKEIDELLVLSNLKEYSSKGFFNSKEFENIEIKANRLAKKQTYKDMSKMNTKLNDIEINELLTKNKIKILKENFNINWKPIEKVLTKEFLDEYNKIKNKYDLNQIDLI